MCIFRYASLDDYSAVSEMKNELHSNHAKAEPGFYRSVDKAISRDEFSKLIEKKKIFVLENENKIVGYAQVNELIVKNDPLVFDQKILFIDDFMIDSGEKGKGHGQEIFDQLMKYSKNNGFTSIELNVWDFNEVGKRFYEKMGMKKTRIRMRKDL